MRFLFFNFVVGGALFYLIFGNPGDVARDTGFSEATASVIENLRQKARKTVSDAVAVKPERAYEASSKNVPWVAKSTEKNALEEQKVKAKTVVKNARPVSTLPVKAAPVQNQDVAVTPPNVKPEVIRPVQVTPLPKPDINNVASLKSESLSRATKKRRAEVLGDIVPSKSNSVEDGGFMSAKERYSEPTKLVDDMELIYLSSLGN
mgnify:FL=1